MAEMEEDGEDITILVCYGTVLALGQTFCDRQTILKLFYSFLMQLAQLDVIKVKG